MLVRSMKDMKDGALRDIARGLAGEPWDERGLAVLLLENRMLRAGGFDARLTRMRPVHEALERGEWDYVRRAARDLSKLHLARFFFSVDEVVERICSVLRVSSGAPAAAIEFHGAELPEYEAAIVAKLCAHNRIYWVSEGCGSELNGLVEYPLTTAVVVIKVPGSDFEFEIKRAGTRGARLLSVIAKKNGRDAPTSHRLFGGSLGWLAVREAASANRFSKIYRLVHGRPAPFSHALQNSAVVTVPGTNGEAHLLDYLSSAEVFGEGFDEMREAMRTCAAQFPSDTGVPRASYAGEGGETLQFVGQAWPQQAIISGSSSFRLDRLALYLPEAGPREYFGARVPDVWELRWFVDSLLQEILGELDSPPEGFVTVEQYLRDAFAAPVNRARADGAFVSVLRQLGECWGTLLALRGYTDGESFVQRNVGLKSVWRDGAWRVSAISMDHDDLTFAGSRYGYGWPSREAPGMMRDEVHLLGGPLSGETIPGDVGALAAIYRVDEACRARGIAELRESLCAAYDATQASIAGDALVQEMVYPEFVRGYRDLDFVAGRMLACGEWKSESLEYLKGQGRGPELAAETVETVERFRAFFERMRFLFGRGPV